MNCNIDYGELLNYLADEAEERTLQAAYAYVPIDPRQEHAKDEIINDLWQNGYIVKSKVGTVAGETYKCNNRGYGGAFGQTEEEMEFMRQGQWKWYCTHIKPGAWQPARLRQISDWRHGDNLWDIITLCIDVLTHPLDD